MNALSAIFLVWMVCFSLLASAQRDTQQQDGLAVSVVFDAAGNLWRVGVNDGAVQVGVSHDLAKSFSKPVTLNQPVLNNAAGNSIQPKIAMGPEGNIYVAWAEMSSGQLAGAIWFSRSINGGKSFEDSVLVHQGRTTAATLNVAPNGKITLIWQEVTGSEAPEAIYYAVSGNGGVAFESAQKLADGASACGSILTTNKPDGTVTTMWQHQFEGGEFDYMLAEIPAAVNQSLVIQRATFNHGKADACLEGGSALAIGGAGQDWWGYHMVYFSDSVKKPGLYYSRMDGVAWASSPAKRVGNAQHQASQPALLSLGDNVWLVWRELNGTSYLIMGMFSDDGGKSWQDAKVLASTAGLGGSPQLIAPQLITKDKQVYLAWNSQQECFRLIALPM